MFRKISLLTLSLLMLVMSFTAHAGSDRDLPGEIYYTQEVIKGTYGEEVSVYSKAKRLLKFGRNLLVGTSQTTVMILPSGELHETYVNTNVIDKFSSSSANDGETMKVEGHTCSGSGTSLQLAFVVQSITLQGQAETSLSTPLCRITRAFNTDSTALEGAIYFYQDDTVASGIPQTAAKIHMTITAGKQQSIKAATAVENNNYAICTEVYGSILEKAASFADFELQVREVGGVFREQFQFAVASQGGASKFIKLSPPIIVPENADVRLVAAADNASTPVSGGFNCYLAQVN